MEAHAGVIVRVIVQAKGRAGERFAIVQLDDGLLGITQNEQVLQTLRYATTDVESCVAEFVRRTGLRLGKDA